MKHIGYIRHMERTDNTRFPNIVMQFKVFEERRRRRRVTKTWKGYVKKALEQFGIPPEWSRNRKL